MLVNLALLNLQGCSPKKWIKDSFNRPEFLNQNWDIERSFPRALHLCIFSFILFLLELNKPEYNLSNADIEKSKPNYIKFSTTRPPCNPLDPVYKLPEVEFRPPTPPKFIRDNIDNKDIDGAKPKKPKYYETRDILNVNDIDGTKVKETYVRKTAYDSFNYNDITKVRFKS